MLDREHSAYHNDFLIAVLPWGARPMVMTQEKVRWLWAEMNKFRALFSDLTIGSIDNFTNLITLPDSYWLDVINIETKKSVGVVYLLNVTSNPEVHIMFFDRVFKDKLELSKTLMRFLFATFMFHRITAVTPVIYRNTILFAKKLGFREEGIRRESILVGGRWLDEVMLGILDSEVA